VDSEYLLGLLSEEGYQVVDDPAEAETIVVNTCAFIQPAVTESVETILELAEYKKTGRLVTLAVVGCLPQRYKNDLASSLPEVDLIWGSGGLDKVRAVESRRGRPGFGDLAGSRICALSPGRALDQFLFIKLILRSRKAVPIPVPSVLSPVCGVPCEVDPSKCCSRKLRLWPKPESRN
jgi:hypothetical protein